jgi:hypothetical protein
MSNSLNIDTMRKLFLGFGILLSLSFLISCGRPTPDTSGDTLKKDTIYPKFDSTKRDNTSVGGDSEQVNSRSNAL